MNDYIVFGNNSKAVRSPYCGLRNPFALVTGASYSSPAVLTFNTNNDLEEQGFSAMFLAVNDTPEICKCRRVFSSLPFKN